MNMNDPVLQRELDKTKIALMQMKDAVFFITIIFSLKFKWDPTCSTAWTDGYSFGWNPDFFMKATKGQRIFVMVHEACHVAQDHIGRLMGRDMALWNKAADHNINLMLKARGFEMWDWVLCDPRFTGMSTDQIYNILKAEQCSAPNPMEDCRQPGSGDPGAPKPTDEQHQKHIENILMRAAVQSKMAGETAGVMPGEVELFLKKLMRPKLPWQTILRREVNASCKSGFTWSKPNRRYWPDHYLPARWGTGPTDLDVYVDISGSVQDYQFHRFVSEIAGALRNFNLKRVRIVQFDTRIQHDDTVSSMAQLSKVKFTGRGGTRIEPVYEDIDKHKPKLAVIITDGCFGQTRNRMQGNITWLINDNPRFTAPFGKVIHFKTTEL